MEQAIVTKPKTIQELQKDRTHIYQKKLSDPSTAQYPSDYILFQENWLKFHKLLKTGDHAQNYESFNFEGCSFLGLATIALQSKKNDNEYITVTIMRKKKLLNTKNPIQVPFKEKKECIQTLQNIVHFNPTPKDKEFALLEKWERCYPKYILLRHHPLIPELTIPSEIIQIIKSLIWDSEKSLF